MCFYHKTPNAYGGEVVRQYLTMSKHYLSYVGIIIFDACHFIYTTLIFFAYLIDSTFRTFRIFWCEKAFIAVHIIMTYNVVV